MRLPVLPSVLMAHGRLLQEQPFHRPCSQWSNRLEKIELSITALGITGTMDLFKGVQTKSLLINRKAVHKAQFDIKPS
jgi:hypothetical protein